MEEGMQTRKIVLLVVIILAVLVALVLLVYYLLTGTYEEAEAEQDRIQREAEQKVNDLIKRVAVDYTAIPP